MENVDFQQIFKVYPLREVPFSPRRTEIISGLLAEGEIAMLTGAPGSGKSLFAASLVMAVATGIDFYGRSSIAGPVIWIAAEKSRETTRRLIAMSDIGDPISIIEKAPQAADEDHVNAVITNIQSAEFQSTPRLIVIDTLARISDGLEENSSRDMGTVIRGLDRLTQAFPEMALLIVHHTGKDGSDVRGSSAITGAVDLVLRVDGSKAVKTATIRKANSIPEGQTFSFTIDTIADEFDDPVAIAVQVAGPDVRISQQATKSTLKGWPDKLFKLIPADGCTIEECRIALVNTHPDSTKFHFRDAKNALFKRGLITEEEGTVRRCEITLKS